MEEWKAIKDFERLYEVSNLGRVRSLEKNWEIANGGIRHKDETMLKPTNNGSGYLQVNLNSGGIRTTRVVHQLVWDHFGCKLRNGRALQVDHIDHDKTNNRIDNLQLLTPRENICKHHETKKSSSSFMGVSWHGQNKKWVSNIHKNGKDKYLGSFYCETQAALAYEKAALN